MEQFREALESYDKALESRSLLPDGGKRIFSRWTVLTLSTACVAIRSGDIEVAKRLASRFKETLENARKDGFEEIILRTKQEMEQKAALAEGLKKFNDLFEQSSAS